MGSAGGGVSPDLDAAVEGSITGTADLSSNVDLSVNYNIKLDIDKTGTFVTVDCRGGTPAATTIAEITTILNAAGFGTIATNRIFVSSNGSTLIYSVDNSISLSSWQHVLITRASSGNPTNIYINGILSDGGTHNSGTPAGGTTNTFIGNRNANDRTFDGHMVDGRIWNKILSTAERTQEFNRKRHIYQP